MVDVEVTINGEKKTIKVEKVKFGVYMRLLRKCTKTEMLGSELKSTLDTTEYRWEMLKASVGNQINIEELDVPEGLRLEQIITELNSEKSFPEKS